MRPSPRTPPLDAFPSSPSSAWSCSASRRWPSSANHDCLPPLTPDSYFAPSPAIVGSDEFPLHLDVQLDKMESSRKSSITQLFPQPAVPSPKLDPCFLSADDMGKVQVFSSNRGRWENMYDRLESSPPLRARNPPRVPTWSRNSPNDDFSWEATHSALVDSNELLDPSRCSLLIHEVSLLVGLSADDDLSSDNCPLVSDVSNQAPDIQPLSLTPTKSLTSRRHPSRHLCTNIPNHPAHIPISPSINLHTDIANPSLRNKQPLLGSKDLAPIPRQRGTDAGRPSLSPHRRHGQVFPTELPPSHSPRRNAVILDETFFHPREPPPKPTAKSLANRCSSLDRLEHSLRKLEAHAPGNHRKSQSEGWSPGHFSQRKDKRPSLPPPRRLKSHQINRNPSHLAPPVPRPTPLIPRACPAVPLGDGHREEDLTPGSFMDMDIPRAGRRASLRQLASKHKMKSLVNVAKRVSRGVITWGKNLTGSTKQETTTA